MKKINQKGFGIAEGLLIALVVIAVGLLGWYGFSRMQENKDDTTESLDKRSSSETVKVENSPLSGYKTYSPESSDCTFEHSENLGKATSKPKETALQGKYVVVSFNNSGDEFNFYCSAVNDFSFKYFSGASLKASNGRFIVVSYDGKTSTSDGLDVKVGEYDWHKVQTGDAGASEYIYFLQTDNNKVIGLGFSSDQIAERILPRIRNLE